jgi:hypothetical protein
VTVTIAAGAPSAEGPRRTVAAQDWSFRTYGPFRVRRHECGGGGRCTPFDPWRVELTNPADARSAPQRLVRVEPELPGLKVEAWGDTLAIRGSPRGRTTYRVTLSSGIRDTFGQPLEPGKPLAFAVGEAPAALFAPGGDFVVLDPGGGRAFTVLSVNHDSLRVQAYAVGPEDWAAWHAYRQRGWRNEAGVTPPGRRVIDSTCGGSDRRARRDTIDLSPASAASASVLVMRPVTRMVPAGPHPWVQSANQPGRVRRPDARRVGNDLGDGPPGDFGRAAAPQARSDASGLARLALGDAPAPLLVARRGPDLAILPSQTGWWAEGAGWRRTARMDALRFLVFDDRKMYRPGETARVKGWLRRIGAGLRGDVEALPSEVSTLAWALVDSQGNEVEKGEARVSGLGGFDLALLLPKTMNLAARRSLEAKGDLPGRGTSTASRSRSSGGRSSR